MANIRNKFLLAHLFNRKDYGQNLNIIQAFLQIVKEQTFVKTTQRLLVELSGLEPLTFCLQSRRSTN